MVAEASIILISDVSKIENSANIDIKKNISPSCDIQKTFKAALIVLDLANQYWISKKDIKLIHSQKNIIEKRSPQEKKTKASCEKIDDRLTIVRPFRS